MTHGFRYRCIAGRDRVVLSENYHICILRSRFHNNVEFSDGIIILRVTKLKFSCVGSFKKFKPNQPHSNVNTNSHKKVLLRERKRHTARRVASTRYAALSNPDLVGGVPHPDLVGGYPGYPPELGWGTPRTGMGYPPQTLNWVPPRPGMGYPLARPGMGYPPKLGWGTPTWDRVPPT